METNTDNVRNAYAEAGMTTVYDQAKALVPLLTLAQAVQLTVDLGTNIKERLTEAKGALTAYKRAVKFAEREGDDD